MFHYNTIMSYEYCYVNGKPIGIHYPKNQTTTDAKVTIEAPLQTTTLHERQIVDLTEENTKLRLALELLDKRVAYLEKHSLTYTWHDQDGNPLPQNQ